MITVFSLRVIQGMMEGHGWGVAHGHIGKYVLKACRADMPSVCWEEHWII